MDGSSIATRAELAELEQRLDAKIAREHRILETFLALKVNEVVARVVDQLLDEKLVHMENRIEEIVDGKLSFVKLPEQVVASSTSSDVVGPVGQGAEAPAPVPTPPVPTPPAAPLVVEAPSSPPKESEVTVCEQPVAAEQNNDVSVAAEPPPPTPVVAEGAEPHAAVDAPVQAEPPVSSQVEPPATASLVDAPSPEQPAAAEPAPTPEQPADQVPDAAATAPEGTASLPSPDVIPDTAVPPAAVPPEALKRAAPSKNERKGLVMRTNRRGMALNL